MKTLFNVVARVLLAGICLCWSASVMAASQPEAHTLTIGTNGQFVYAPPTNTLRAAAGLSNVVAGVVVTSPLVVTSTNPVLPLVSIPAATATNAGHMTAAHAQALTNALPRAEANATYLTEEVDPGFWGHIVSEIGEADLVAWGTAYGWGNHRTNGYLTNEPVFLASPAAEITTTNLTELLVAYSHSTNQGNPHNTTLSSMIAAGDAGDVPMSDGTNYAPRPLSYWWTNQLASGISTNLTNYWGAKQAALPNGTNTGDVLTWVASAWVAGSFPTNTSNQIVAVTPLYTTPVGSNQAFAIYEAGPSQAGSLSSSNFSYFAGKEPAAGAPSSRSSVWASTTNGTRSWIGYDTNATANTVPIRDDDGDLAGHVLVYETSIDPTETGVRIYTDSATPTIDAWKYGFGGGLQAMKIETAELDINQASGGPVRFVDGYQSGYRLLDESHPASGISTNLTNYWGGKADGAHVHSTNDITGLNLWHTNAASAIALRFLTSDWLASVASGISAGLTNYWAGETNALPSTLAKRDSQTNLHARTFIGTGTSPSADLNDARNYSGTQHAGDGQTLGRVSFTSSGQTQYWAGVQAVLSPTDASYGRGVELSLVTGQTSGTNGEAMRISRTGNVGIGTNQPAAKLHVVGNLLVSGQITNAGGLVVSFPGFAGSGTAATAARTDHTHYTNDVLGLMSWMTNTATAISARFLTSDWLASVASGISAGLTNYWGGSTALGANTLAKRDANGTLIASNLWIGPNASGSRFVVDARDLALYRSQLKYDGYALGLTGETNLDTYPYFEWRNTTNRAGYLGWGSAGSRYLRFGYDWMTNLVFGGPIQASGVVITGSGDVYHPGNRPATNVVTGLTAWMTNAAVAIAAKLDTSTWGSSVASGLSVGLTNYWGGKADGAHVHSTNDVTGLTLWQTNVATAIAQRSLTGHVHTADQVNPGVFTGDYTVRGKLTIDNGTNVYDAGLLSQTRSGQTSMGNHPVAILANPTNLLGAGIALRFAAHGASSNLATLAQIGGIVETQATGSALIGGMQLTVSDGTGLVHALRIKPSGATGIGTTNPLAMLHVAGSGRFDGALTVGGHPVLTNITEHSHSTNDVTGMTNWMAVHKHGTNDVTGLNTTVTNLASAIAAKVSFPGFGGSGSANSASRTDHDHGTYYAPWSHNHSAAEITSGTLATNLIPDLPAYKITSGTLDLARIPSLPGSLIGSGTIDSARLPVGTGATNVAAGNHSHSGVYSAVGHAHSGYEITSGVIGLSYLPTGTSSGTVALGDHNHSGVYAPSAHYHDALEVTTGILPYTRGGTGNNGYNHMELLRFNGTNNQIESSGLTSTSWAAPDGWNAHGTWPISITGNAGSVDGHDAADFAGVAHNHTGTYEPAIANPAYDGMLLASSASGSRSWVYRTSNADANTVVSRDGSGNANFNICLATRLYASQRLDTPIVENDATGGVIDLKLNGITRASVTGNGIEVASGYALIGAHKSSSGSPGISTSIDVLVPGGGTNRLTFESGLLVTNRTL